jgi:hypothetical protein
MAASSLSRFPTITPTTDDKAYSEVVSRTSISFESKTIPICIQAFIDARGTFYPPYKPSMVFEVELEDKPGDIGRFSIMRIWDKIDSQGNLQLDPHYEGDPIETHDRLRHRRLFIDGIVDHLGVDANGFSPVVALLTQLAVEILSREVERELVIDTTAAPRHFNATPIFSGGFTARKICFLDMEIGEEGVLLKSSQGQLMTPQENGPATSAQVAFCANKTWEQVIQDRPLLNYAPGPIMPVFENLSAYERGF